MADVEIIIDDEAAMALLEHMPQQLNRALRASMTDATVLLQRQLKQYPPPPDAIQGTAYAPVRFQTRQGRSVNFMAARRKPYNRTGTLGRLWNRRVEQDADGVTGIVGNNTPYAPYVQDATRQNHIHADRWPTIQSVSSESESQIRSMFRARISEMLR